MFDGCKLTRLSIPSDIALTSIPKYAFRNNSLTGKIVFPSQITSFGSFAFGGDDDSKNSLTSVEFQATGLLLSLIHISLRIGLIPKPRGGRKGAGGGKRPERADEVGVERFFHEEGKG